MVELFRRRPLEGVDLAALGIDAGHDVLDRAVLARRVHGLEDEQHSPLDLGVEPVLHLGKAGDALLQELFRFLLGLDAAGVAGLRPGEPEVFSVRDPERLDQGLQALLALLLGLFLRHLDASR